MERVSGLWLLKWACIVSLRHFFWRSCSWSYLLKATFNHLILLSSFKINCESLFGGNGHETNQQPSQQQIQIWARNPPSKAILMNKKVKSMLVIFSWRQTDSVQRIRLRRPNVKLSRFHAALWNCWKVSPERWR